MKLKKEFKKLQKTKLRAPKKLMNGAHKSDLTYLTIEELKTCERDMKRLMLMQLWMVILTNSLKRI